MEGPPGSLPARLLHLAWMFSFPCAQMSNLKRRRKGEAIFPQPGPWPAWEETASASGSCFQQVIKGLISVEALGHNSGTMWDMERPCLILASRSYMTCPRSPCLARLPLVPGSSFCSFIHAVASNLACCMLGFLDCKDTQEP